MDYRVYTISDTKKMISGINEHRNTVEFEIDIDSSFRDADELIESSKTMLEREKEQAIKEKEKAEEEKQVVEAQKVELETKNEELKLSIESILERYAEFVETKEDYQVGKDYKAGDTFKYNGVVYAVIQGHISQAEWTPDNTPALYKALRQTEEAGDDAVIKEWVQPTGGHDIYNTGDKVIYQGVIYQSTIDNNSWSPIDYPQGWERIE